MRARPGTVFRNEATGKVVYTPPVRRERIMLLLGSLEEYIRRDDGNGRTGRIVNIFHLVQHGFLELPVLYLSREIIEGKENYYRSLKEVRTSDSWEEWILFMLVTVERLFVQLYVKTEHLVIAGIAERRTAAKYLRQLEEIGVLSSFTTWRETIFANSGLVKLPKE